MAVATGLIAVSSVLSGAYSRAKEREVSAETLEEAGGKVEGPAL